ncbi:hypothetical protein A1Q1_01177 [Trichosporon asahii var. asahii CBS 2479]|uniref:Uncharacterized protein n=1 Tax=Trichosporon asahii var. asahii (strain ATCC 90039 / CBS 2479 / JCM 2466 / KCTC 7840 / NBRC 103889/ NCYC 2677 / UAMH 7654) TaxID=1186058 RepID=J6EYF0_TRIAS|nr:hypothetical protein A1Q1_01177 [Trichosporon asahii var. asahii CBS 2479]EJT49679.1 hypothetical protein A1Q1_01177 [Trichosporon asahii var. asahii CBS 2479]
MLSNLLFVTIRKDTSSIERAVLDRMGPQLGGSSKNSSGELDSLGWPSNCTNACAPYTAVIEEKGICDTYSGVEANATCTSGYKMKIWDQCAGSVEGIDMSKVSAGHYVATVSAASAFIAMGAGMLISLV